MLDKIANTFNFLQHSLDLRAYRTEVLASNMANAETPNYKAVDFDFAAALRAQTTAAGVATSLTLNATDMRHFSSAPDSGGHGAKLQYRAALQPSIDGNTVDMDLERGEFAANALNYQSTLTFLNNRISSINSVLKG